MAVATSICTYFLGSITIQCVVHVCSTGCCYIYQGNYTKICRRICESQDHVKNYGPEYLMHIQRNADAIKNKAFENGNCKI